MAACHWQVLMSEVCLEHTSLVCLIPVANTHPHPPSPMCNCVGAPKWLDTHTHTYKAKQAKQIIGIVASIFTNPSALSSIFTAQVVRIVCLVQSALSPQFVFLLICLTLTELFTTTLPLKRFKYILVILNCLLKL